MERDYNIGPLERWGQNAELLAAVLSGLLIAAGWAFQQSQPQTSIVLFILAFLIGGFAKAKEGIGETIANRTLNVELLMIFAAIGSAVIGHWLEGAILIFIFSLSGALETYTMNKSQKEISALMKIQPEEAIVINGDEYSRVHVSELQKGDFILVKPGERIPADGILVSGQTTVDQSAITGESIPADKYEQDEFFAGTVNLTGSITIEVTKTSNDSLFSKIIEMVQSAQSAKSPSQLFIERFENTYVKTVLAAVLIMMIVPHFAFGWSWNETFYRAMVLMVVASPCALVASIMPASLSAISNGARNGLLFKGGVHLERLSRAKVIAFDKTGTLTKGEPEVTDVRLRKELDETDLYSAVLSIETQSNHPLAKAIVNFARQAEGVQSRWTAVTEHSGMGVGAQWNGSEFLIGKEEFVGAEEARSFSGGAAEKLAEEGKTVVFVRDGEGIAAVFALKDTLRTETKDAINSFRENGLQTVMLTGDSEVTAKSIAREAKLDDYRAECMPQDKLDEIKKRKSNDGITIMVGDGINDAPALALADIGIAMGEGSDAALETADIVLMKNNLQKLSEAIRLSKRMNRIVKQNIIFSMAVIALLICSNFLQVISLPFGVIGHEGSTILVILNGLRLLKN
ncbi:cadmium-translocating P-type ATPase [Bacillus sp. FJAT-42376]|uniref:heavy metal translocating P-type ATPase n=1 Tax=Bacillus sp. FJAT-42376 TaxID=2014076 RepID=UPI000F4D62C7|nr:heavy metal translocating P-type ATPase [Bacillus sp. FJAT-42376]AZB42569.1 cadmium-translocating P-type ATPase [Bacillus sp. FJAT-42376]